MSVKLKEQARALQAQKAAKAAKLAEGRAEIKKMIEAAGVEETIGTKAFNDALEEASRPIDALAEEVGEIDRSWGLVMTQLGEGTPAANPFADPASPVAVDPRGSWGERFVASQVYKDLVASGRLTQETAQIGRTDGVQMTNGRNEVKALLTSGSWPLAPDRQTDVVNFPRETVTILDLISIGATSTEIVEWVRQKTRTENITSVAEGVAPSESTYEWEIVQAQVREIAHFAKTTKRAIRDEQQLLTLTDQEMIEGLRVAAQSLIISGDGIGENFLGLLNTPGIGLQAKAAETWADAIHKAITKVRIATLGATEPTVIGIHPNDFEAHALAKDTTGNYLNGGPNTNGPATIWGLKPVVHVAFPAGNPLVGDYKRAKLWIWSDVQVAMTDSNEDDFKRRLLALMASFGGAFGVLEPKAFCEIQ